MASYANPEDLEVVWRPLTDAQTDTAETYLAYASAILRQRVATLDDRIAAGTLDRILVQGVVVAMVKRVMSNPDGLRQRTVGSVSLTFDEARAAGIDPTAEELELLVPRRTGRGAPRTARLGIGLGFRR